MQAGDGSRGLFINGRRNATMQAHELNLHGSNSEAGVNVYTADVESGNTGSINVRTGSSNNGQTGLVIISSGGSLGGGSGRRRLRARLLDQGNAASQTSPAPGISVSAWEIPSHECVCTVPRGYCQSIGQALKLFYFVLFVLFVPQLVYTD